MARKKSVEILQSKETPVEPVKEVSKEELLENWSGVYKEGDVGPAGIHGELGPQDGPDLGGRIGVAGDVGQQGDSGKTDELFLTLSPNGLEGAKGPTGHVGNPGLPTVVADVGLGLTEGQDSKNLDLFDKAYDVDVISTKQPFPELKQSKEGGLTFYDIA